MVLQPESGTMVVSQVDSHGSSTGKTGSAAQGIVSSHVKPPIILG